jgi:hypothetical protein
MIAEKAADIIKGVKLPQNCAPVYQTDWQSRQR